MNWTDVNGSQTGNLAFFDAHADLASVSFVDISGQSLTALSGLAALPALTHLECSSDSLTTLDISGNPLLTEVHANATSLTTLDISSNPLLTTVDLQSCNLTTAEVNAILAQLVASGQTGGTVYLQAQASLAPPSAGPPNGIAAAAALLAESPPWMVNTDVGLHSTATAWAARVVTNGGAAPSSPTIAALSDFAYALDAAGLTSKLKCVNCIVPDSLIAALTPLLVTSGGSALWAGHNFVSGDLTVNGLAGDGSTKYAETGLVPVSAVTALSAGLTVYYDTYVNEAAVELGSSDYLVAQSALYLYSGVIYFDCHKTTGGQEINHALTSAGYVSGNRVSSSSFDIYYANSSTAHSSLVHGTASATTPSTTAMYAWAFNNNGTPAYYSSKRLSFMAVHDGLSSTDSVNFYNAVQALRTALGGGYVTSAVTGLHSTATAWAARVVTNGGAAPSSPTIAALSDFAYALDAAGLTSLMIAVNCLVPDNLIAAYTPLIVGGGRDPWLAHNFYPGYLSVNGLAGDRGSATYLQTGIIPSTVYGSVNDAGLSVYVWSNTYYGGRREIAATPSDGSSSALLCCYNGTAYWDAYTDGGTGRVSYSSAGNPEGFFSGSRTDSSHEYLYFANSGNAFAQKAGPGGAPGATLPNIEYYAFAQNNNGSPADSVSGSLSFIAIHHGLTSAQSQDFYNAVQAMRTSLGGGYR